MIGFKEYNANPKKRKTCDCVIRALTLATNKDYMDVYKELFEISLESGYMINEKRVEEKFLENNGFVKMKQPRKNDNSKYMVGEIDKVCKSDVIVISCAHHLTCVKDGVLMDLWDCRRKCVGNYFVKLGGK